MAEYIDRRKIRYTWWQKQDGTITDGVTLQSIIDDIPTADVVPVVRCCDCKHRQENPDINNTCYLTCNKIHGIQRTIEPDDYCSYGERK